MAWGGMWGGWMGAGQHPGEIPDCEVVGGDSRGGWELFMESLGGCLVRGEVGPPGRKGDCRVRPQRRRGGSWGEDGL